MVVAAARPGNICDVLATITKLCALLDVDDKGFPVNKTVKTHYIESEDQNKES